MPRKKIKDVIRKEDILLRTLRLGYEWFLSNQKLSIIAACILLLLVGSAYGYKLYDASRDDKAQYLLSEGIEAFQEYQATMKDEPMNKAEGLFNKLMAGGRRGTSDIARLYLAKIYLMKGQNDKAVAMYKAAAAATSSELLKQLSESALRQIEKK